MRLPKRLEHDQTAELVEHLGELRSRMIIALLALAAGFAVAYGFHHELLTGSTSPSRRGDAAQRPSALPNHSRPRSRSASTRALRSRCRSSSGNSGAFSPPPSTPRPRAPSRALPSSQAHCLHSGVAFAYKLALPAAVHYLTNYDSGAYNIQIRASSYYSFALSSLLAIGLVFELPVFVLALVRIGALTSSKLRRNRRIGYFLMALIALALPGVDPVTTAFEIVPLIGLFEFSIWLAVLFEQRWWTADRLAAAEI
jgi:sec-independent protein translocase protein TatC